MSDEAETPVPLSAGQEETIAFNLCAVHGFDPDFVKTQRDFAIAVIREYEVSKPRLAPADVSTKPLETNTSAEHVKETAKTEHVTAPVEADCGIHGRVPGPVCIRCAELGSPMGSTAPVEAGGSERGDALLRRAKGMKALGAHSITVRIDELEATLRPQPSGETLQSLAQAFEDAMEGSHGAWAVSGDYSPLSATTVADKIQADTDAKLTDCPSGETREAVARVRKQLNDLRRPFDNVVTCEAADLRTILALIRPAAPDGGGLADLAARVTAEVKRGADGSHVQALGALSNIEAMVRAAIPASEGGRG